MRCDDDCIVTTIVVLCITIIVTLAIYAKHTQKMEEYKLMELNCTKILGEKL